MYIPKDTSNGWQLPTCGLWLHSHAVQDLGPSPFGVRPHPVSSCQFQKQRNSLIFEEKNSEMPALAVKHRLPDNLWVGLFRGNPSSLGGWSAPHARCSFSAHASPCHIWIEVSSAASFPFRLPSQFVQQPFHKEELWLEMRSPRPLTRSEKLD